MKNRQKAGFSLSIFALLTAAVALTSCGGTGGGDPQPTPPSLSSITVTAASVSVLVGQTDQLTATGHYSDGTTQNLTSSASWSSSNQSMATVSSAGIVTGVAATTAVTVTASDGTISGSATIAVTAPAITQATLAWKDFQTMGTQQSDIEAITLLNGSVVAVGRGIAATGNLAFALSYSESGGPPPHQFSTNDGSGVGYTAVAASGNVALVGGDHGGTFGDITVFDSNMTMKADDFCPSTPFTGGLNAIAVGGSSVYLGLTRNPHYPPAIVTSDASGNINCGSLTALPEDNSARIGSVVAASDHILVVGDTTAISPIAGWIVKLGTDFSVKAQKTIPGIILPRATEVTEGGSVFVYLVGTTFNGTSSQLIWVDKLDSNLNEVSGWPKTWDGDNPNFAGIAANWGNAIVPNPGSAGGVIAIGQITETPPNTDPNRGDCGLIAYKPDGTVAWKVRQDFSGGDSCTAAAVDPASFSLFVGGSVNTFTPQQQTLVAGFALPH